MAPPKLQPALLGGLFAGVLSALPFVNMANCCCLWVIAGGVMAAYIMQQNHPLPVTLGNGASVGLLAGIFGAIITFAAATLIRQLFGPMLPGFVAAPGTFRTRRDMPPEVRDVMRSIGPHALAILSGILFVVIELVFSTLGGLFGALAFRKAGAPAEPPPPPSHPPVIPPAGPPVESWTYPDQDKTPE
jgi:hypothetical protein